MSNATRDMFDGEEVAEVLSGTYYARGSNARLRAAPAPEARPAHYKVICISMYNQDLERLDGMVDELKKRGFTKANRSALIRFALEQADLSKVKKGF
ncbi:MAG: hypothetical protein JNL79_28810 [Myxococcales bacterium]|nr:hypothetical protein [Myxococcales bacterium]